jgi:hypothetical protein
MGTTVIGGLGPGLGQSINPFSQEFQKQQLINTLTQQAQTANARAAATYLQTAQDWLTNAVMARDSGRAIPPLADPPLEIHVDQTTGAQASGPDFVAQKPTLPPATGVQSTGTIASTNAPPDRIDQLLAGMAAMYNVVAQLQQEVAAIKGHLGA